MKFRFEYHEVQKIANPDSSNSDYLDENRTGMLQKSTNLLSINEKESQIKQAGALRKIIFEANSIQMKYV